jgi:hypothetical protein
LGSNAPDHINTWPGPFVNSVARVRRSILRDVFPFVLSVISVNFWFVAQLTGNIIAAQGVASMSSGKNSLQFLGRMSSPSHPISACAICQARNNKPQLQKTVKPRNHHVFPKRLADVNDQSCYVSWKDDLLRLHFLQGKCICRVVNSNNTPWLLLSDLIHVLVQTLQLVVDVVSSTIAKTGKILL